MRFLTVLLDLDGTLIDHLPAIHRCYALTLPRLGLPAPTYEQVKGAIGGGLPHAMRHFVAEERREEALAIYRAYWAEHMLDGVSVMPGAEALLTRLAKARVRAAVFTNKHGPSARAVCDHLGLTSRLAGVFGATDTPWLKPDPAFAVHVLNELGARENSTCLVGDSPWDVDAARRAGLAFVGVTTGTHDAAELAAAGAPVVVEDLLSVMRWLETI
jgi:HAD superfamily hydrolase (TIGR01509 family)